MPAPNLNNPLCPVCSRPMTVNGTKSSGAKEYRCKRCKKTKTNSDRAEGRQPLGDKPMSQKELTERWKERDPEGFKASQKKRSKNRKKKPK